jgi:hypothetical protein
MATIKLIKQYITKASFNIWYRRLGYMGKEALLYLLKALIRVKLITTKFNYNKDLCNIYIKSYIKQQISCILVYKGSYPFKKLHFNLIYLHKAFNTDYYFLYFYCPFCGFYINYTLIDKSEDSFI